MVTQDLADPHQIGPEVAICFAAPVVDQREPFHTWVRRTGRPAWGGPKAVIRQNRRDVQDASLDKSNVPFGSSRTDHLDPFHIPRIERKRPVKLDEYTTIPSATQNRGEPHETSVHSL
jgi:hypothetical protein